MQVDQEMLTDNEDDDDDEIGVMNQGLHTKSPRSCDCGKIMRLLGLRFYSLQGDSSQPR